MNRSEFTLHESTEKGVKRKILGFAWWVVKLFVIS